ncbi:MAG: hypothetical protein JXB32_05590 [Deltaproteobacteria bacterium]|nr:hypothetical protein [Deltaproteobacteria bacterium]
MFDEAVAVSEQGDFRSALRLFRASYDLVPVPDALYNIGMCQKALGELPGAANTLRDYVAIVGDRMSEEERLEFDALLAEIAPQIGRVIFVVGEPGVTIAVDGIVAGVTPFPTWVAVAPGAHSIIASKVGFAPATITIDVVGGAVMPVALALGAREVVHVEVPAEAQPVPPAPPPAECPEPASDPPAASSSDLGPWFWTTVAIAGTSAVGMAITGGLTLKYNEDFRASGFIDADARDTTLELRTVTDVLLGVTLAAVVAGALVFLLSGEPDEDAGEEPGTGESPVAVAILPHGLAIAW